MREELYLDENGLLQVRKVRTMGDRPVRRRPTIRHVIPPYTFEVTDHKGDTRKRSDVRHCAICGLWWDLWEMASKKQSYCRICWNHYTGWRRSVESFANSTGTSQDTSMDAFCGKYLSGQLTINPPQQFDPDALGED